MGTYFNNNILLRKTLQVFIVWQKSMAKQYIAECAENLEDTVVPVMVTSWWQFMTSYLIFRYSDIHHDILIYTIFQAIWLQDSRILW